MNYPTRDNKMTEEEARKYCVETFGKADAWFHMQMLRLQGCVIESYDALLDRY